MIDYYKIKHRLWVKVPTEVERESAIAYIEEHRSDARPRAPYFTTILVCSEENDKKTQLLGKWESSICKTLVDVYGIDNIRMKDVEDIFAEIENVEKVGNEIDKEFRRYEKVYNTANSIRSVTEYSISGSLSIIDASALLSISNSLRRIANSLERAYPKPSVLDYLQHEGGFQFVENDEKGESDV